MRDFATLASDIYLCKSLNLSLLSRSSFLFYLAYIFWSILTSLIPSLFYFSVWKLGIAGHELALFSVLSPIFLSLASPFTYIFSSSATPPPPPPFLLRFTSTRRGQVVFHVLSLIGVIAYLVPSPGGRLLFVSVANVIATMRQVVSWAGIVQHENNVSSQAMGKYFSLQTRIPQWLIL